MLAYQRYDPYNKMAILDHPDLLDAMVRRSFIKDCRNEGMSEDEAQQEADRR